MHHPRRIPEVRRAKVKLSMGSLWSRHHTYHHVLHHHYRHDSDMYALSANGEFVHMSNEQAALQIGANALPGGMAEMSNPNKRRRTDQCTNLESFRVPLPQNSTNMSSSMPAIYICGYPSVHATERPVPHVQMAPADVAASGVQSVERGEEPDVAVKTENV